MLVDYYGLEVHRITCEMFLNLGVVNEQYHYKNQRC